MITRTNYQISETCDITMITNSSKLGQGQQKDAKEESVVLKMNVVDEQQPHVGNNKDGTHCEIVLMVLADGGGTPGGVVVGIRCRNNINCIILKFSYFGSYYRNDYEANVTMVLRY